MDEQKYYEGGIPLAPDRTIWFKIPAGLEEKSYNHLFTLIKAILSMQVFGYIQNDVLQEFSSLIDNPAAAWIDASCQPTTESADDTGTVTCNS